MLGHLQQRRSGPLQRQQLKQRIEPHELNARPTEYVLPGDPREGPFHDVLGVWVAVMAGIAEKGTASPEQCKVHSPRIHRQAVRGPELRGTAPNSREQLTVQPEDVPVQAVKRLD